MRSVFVRSIHPLRLQQSRLLLILAQSNAHLGGRRTGTKDSQSVRSSEKRHFEKIKKEGTSDIQRRVTWNNAEENLYRWHRMTQCPDAIHSGANAASKVRV